MFDLGLIGLAAAVVMFVLSCVFLVVGVVFMISVDVTLRATHRELRMIKGELARYVNRGVPQPYVPPAPVIPTDLFFDPPPPFDPSKGPTYKAST